MEVQGQKAAEALGGHVTKVVSDVELHIPKMPFLTQVFKKIADAFGFNYSGLPKTHAILSEVKIALSNLQEAAPKEAKQAAADLGKAFQELLSDKVFTQLEHKENLPKFLQTKGQTRVESAHLHFRVRGNVREDDLLAGFLGGLKPAKGGEKVAVSEFQALRDEQKEVKADIAVLQAEYKNDASVLGLLEAKNTRLAEIENSIFENFDSVLADNVGFKQGESVGNLKNFNELAQLHADLREVKEELVNHGEEWGLMEQGGLNKTTGLLARVNDLMKSVEQAYSDNHELASNIPDTFRTDIEAPNAELATIALSLDKTMGNLPIYVKEAKTVKEANTALLTKLKEHLLAQLDSKALEATKTGSKGLTFLTFKPTLELGGIMLSSLSGDELKEVQKGLEAMGKIVREPEVDLTHQRRAELETAINHLKEEVSSALEKFPDAGKVGRDIDIIF